MVNVCLNFWFSCVMSVFRLLCKCAVNPCRALWSNPPTSSPERKRPREPPVSPVSSFLNKSGQHNPPETPHPAKLEKIRRQIWHILALKVLHKTAIHIRWDVWVLDVETIQDGIATHATKGT